VKLIIANEISKAYPDLRIGVVVARGITNRSRDDRLEELKRKIEDEIRNKYSTEILASHPYIWAWRETYRSFGVKPKKYNPTCEALIRRILNGERIPNINVAVDLYLLVEAEFLLPCGGYDLNKIYGDVHLRYSKGGEEFFPLGSQVVEETNPSEVVYSDAQRILTRKWNFRDSDFTKIEAGSMNIALFTEAARKEIPTKALTEFTERLKDLLNRFCDGCSESMLIDAKQKLEWDIS